MKAASPCRARIRRYRLTLLCLGLAGAAKAADPFEDYIRKTDALTPAQEQKAFHLPPGFEVELVASEPDIGKPMNMAFDARGRLWITQSREYPYAAPLDKPGRDKIKVLSDFDEHGRARKIETFAEGLNIPIGLYPYKNGVIAFSIPNIYYFEDTDGDGKADQRHHILGRFGFDRDVHGLTSSFRRGYDGWLYADHGYNNNTTLTAADGSSITMNSGNCYRFRIDGSRVEQHSWGQVNPFGLMFDQWGDLWSADCHSAPVYQLLHGAYYPSFGKPHDGMGYGPAVCDHDHGSTAIAGMVYYAAENFPPEFRSNTFVGNVMTCRIDRDELVEHGSTRIAQQKPDFLVSDDPWFRPVDLQLGPDGAIYVADFYNRIIGHYEVPLDHPGRDRDSGRIWRISWHGTPVHLALPTTVNGLIQELGNANLARRMLAMNALADRVDPEVAPAVQKLVADPHATATQRAHGLWVLRRLGVLSETTLGAATQDDDRLVRVHAQHILADLAEWNRAQFTQATAGLRDADPYVRRAAADAIGRHPATSLIAPLLEAERALTARPVEDHQLLHVIRLALRDQLKDDGALKSFTVRELSEVESRQIADVAIGIKSADAGAFLARHIQKFDEPADRLNSYLRHAVRYAPESEIGPLTAFARDRFRSDLDFQMALFRSLQESAAERGAALAPAAREWGAELAGRLLTSGAPASTGWHNSPLPGVDPTNPWVLEPRASADGDRASLFVCSLTPGGERFTGRLISGPFVIPAKLSFYLAGHDGFPDKPAQGKNLLRLRSAATGEELAVARPPRNDVAQPFSWDLSAQAGQKGFLELEDGDTGPAYAWIAFGRLSPPVAPFPTVSPRALDQRLRAGTELARSLHLEAVTPQLISLVQDADQDVEARAGAGGALLALDPAAHVNALSNLVSRSSESLKLRGLLAAALGEVNSVATRSALVEALKAAPAALQTQIALGLCSHTEGAEALLDAIAGGKASARLLLVRNVKDRLEAVRPANLEPRLQSLTAHLPAANAERDALVEARRAEFRNTPEAAALGAPLFKQHCAICHSLEGQGASIGPQLDGVGARGSDRLIEDVLDPSRNVDRAFRTSLLILKDGDVQTGLFRREEGEMLILANSAGKEISVPRQEVKERRESETSLMPDNFGDVMTPDDFNHLIAFLLSKGGRQ